MSFEGKIVLITGANSGIGAAAALAFAKLGAKLALSGEDKEGLQKVASECVTRYAPLLLPANLTDDEQTKSIVSKTIERHGQLDILINNAGIWEDGSIENTSLEQYDRLMNVNVRSIYLLTYLAVPYLIKTKGNIVNVSSLTGIRAFPNIIAYSMSKATLDQLTRCVALELASKQVRVNSVNPGIIATDFFLRAGLTKEQYEAFLKRCKDTFPLGRVGETQEVVSAIVFLASEESKFTTGICLPVDGGKHLTTV